jgi:hypothetical protein
VLARLHVRRREDAERVRERVTGAFRVGDDTAPVPPLVLARIG